MLNALVFSTALIVPRQSTSERPIRCDGSTSQRGENVPSSTADRAHTVVHSFSVSMDGIVTAWIYQDEDGSLWFEANGRNAPYHDVTAAARAFGAKMSPALLSNYAQRIPGSVLPSMLAGLHMSIHGCF